MPAKQRGCFTLCGAMAGKRQRQRPAWRLGFEAVDVSCVVTVVCLRGAGSDGEEAGGIQAARVRASHSSALLSDLSVLSVLFSPSQHSMRKLQNQGYPCETC